MQIRLVSKHKNDPNNIIYLMSTEFFMKQLLGKRKYSHVERMHIKVQAVMGDWGECFVRRLKNGNMTVRIKFRERLNFIESISTIAHECVHAKQFITGQLSFDAHDNWIWKGRSYGTDPYKDLTQEQVPIKLPWEKEAVAKENILVTKYLAHYFMLNPA